jgi:hypothetical protein
MRRGERGNSSLLYPSLSSNEPILWLHCLKDLDTAMILEMKQQSSSAEDAA